MAHAKPRLILTDMDRTVLPWGAASVSERTRAAFHRAIASGICCGPATGRAWSWLPPMFSGDTACCATAVATNGLEVWLEGRCIHRETFAHDPIARLVDALAEVPASGLVCFVEEGPLLLAGERASLATWFPAYAEQARIYDGVPDAEIWKANVFVERDRAGTEALARSLSDAVPELDYDVALPGYLNAMPHGWNKGRGVETLCAAIGCTTDAAVVFGDADNDLALFAAVPDSVAVAGATPNARAAARWHIGACEDDAVAEAIERLADGEWPFP